MQAEDSAEAKEGAVPRLRAVVELAGAMLDAVGNERHVISLAEAAAQQVGVAASGWLFADDTAFEAALHRHPAAARDMLAGLVERVRHDEVTDVQQPPALELDNDLHLTALVAPMRARERALGILMVTGTSDFSPDDVEFIDAVAAVAASTLDNARIFADSTAILEDTRRQSELLDHISDAIVACDSEGLIVSWNAGAERMYGYPAGEAVGCDLFALLATDFVTRDGLQLTREDLTEHLKHSGRWDGELRQRRADAAPLTVLSSITEVDGAASGLVVVNRDVTLQRREEHRAMHDPLTDLPNRRMLVNRLYDALTRQRRTGGTLAVLFLDLNKFKPVNDQYGHAVGDELLRETARRLLHAVRSTDVVARLGGDEFLAVLEDAGSVEDVDRAVQRIREAIAMPVQLGDVTVEISSSIGVAFVDDHAGDLVPEQLIEIADAAMYEAKRDGLGASLARAGTSRPTS